jgi:hypothetical protein
MPSSSLMTKTLAGLPVAFSRHFHRSQRRVEVVVRVRGGPSDAESGFASAGLDHVTLKCSYADDVRHFK